MLIIYIKSLLAQTLDRISPHAKVQNKLPEPSYPLIAPTQFHTMNHQVVSATAGPSPIHIDHSASRSLVPSHRAFAVALQNLNRCSYIFLTDLDRRDQSEQALRKAKEAYRHLTYPQCKNSWISLLLAHQTIGTAEVEHVKLNISSVVIDHCSD